MIVPKEVKSCVNWPLTSFLFLWTRCKELVYQNVIPVDTAAPDINCDISHTAKSQVILIISNHWFSVSNEYLCLHLLTAVEVRASTLFTSGGAKNLCYCL